MAATDLLLHPTYGMAQVDRLLTLSPGTARRWIEGYARGGRRYDPVIRLEATGEELVTWGEFVETRLLAEYRNAGVPLIRMRPAIERLRETFDSPFPLALAGPYLGVEGHELVLAIQQEVGLDRHLQLVETARGGQIILAPRADRFRAAATFGDRGYVERLRPITEIEEVLLDPLRQFGEPVVRSVRTEVIAEQVRAGEPIASIAAAYDLDLHLVEAAVRYELMRAAPHELAESA